MPTLAAGALALILMAGLSPAHAAPDAGPGSLLAFGDNSSGELGSATNAGTLAANPTPALVGLPGEIGPVTRVAAGGAHNLAVTATGQLFAFGDNRYGQLGSAGNTGTDTANPTPAPVTLPGEIGPVTEVAGGGDHSLVVTASGQLYAFGDNRYGQLGSVGNSGTESPNPTPALVTLPGEVGPVTRVAAGDDHSLVVTASGQLYAFGDNRYGELGGATNAGASTPNPTPTRVGLPGQIGPVTEVAAGFQDSLVVTASGQLYAFGFNLHGELGDASNGTPNPTPALVTLPGEVGPVTQVAAGYDHSLAVTAGGQLYAFGFNLFGQLGSAANAGSNTANPTPALVTLPGEVGPVTQVAAGGEHSLVVTAGGQLYAFGDNRYGELGNTTNNDTDTPNPTPTPVALGPGTSIDAVAQGPDAVHALALVGDLALAGDALPAARAGAPYRAALQATGGIGSLRFAAAGLPEGLTLEPSTGVIAGTPSASGAFSLALSVSDTDGSRAARTLALTVSPAPAGGGPGANAPAPALVVAGRAAAPRLGALGQSAARWRLGPGLPRLGTGAQATAHVRGLPVGTSFRFSLDRPARVSLRFTRLLPGSRSGRRCLAVGARGARCTRALEAGTLGLDAPGGLSRLRFAGRLGARAALRPGRYRLSVVATDAAGRSSPARTLAFTVARAAR